MARQSRIPGKTKKKTRQGNGKYSKFSQKGSQSTGGGKTPKGYRKRYRGQGR
tara:strand:- start:18728 stop:18883 length:156 start_codon:yes stop_codon:yes gene_type:complete